MTTDHTTTIREPDGPKHSIVVGVDGSKHAAAALDWAAHEARLRGGELLVVHAWQPVVSINFGYTPNVPIAVYEEAAERIMRDAVKAAAIDPDVTVREEVVCESPARALVQASRHADLVVVGARGHGGFAGLLLGSVSQQVAHHAECPVVIVHAKDL